MNGYQKVFHIKGRIIDSNSNQGVQGLRVEAWDNDLICDDLVGSAMTDAHGAFEMKFTEAYFREWFVDRRPDLFFKVYLKQRRIASTENKVLWNVRAGEIPITIEVNVPAPSKPTRFAVQGKIRRADGTPLAGAVVRAYDKDLRKLTLLGSKVTDKEGAYRITYSAAKFSRAEKGTADLVIRVFERHGVGKQKKEKEIAKSDIIFNASPVEQWNPVIGGKEYAGPSEYEELVDELTPLLEGQGVSFVDLEEDEYAGEGGKQDRYHDITFLTRETGEERQRIEFLVQAHRLEKKTKLPAAVFYGLFREGLPSELPELLAQGPDLQRTALLAAVEKNIIPLQFGTDTAIQETLEKLKKLIVQQAFEPPPGQPQQPAPAALVATVLPEKKQQEYFIEHFITHSGSAE